MSTDSPIVAFQSREDVLGCAVRFWAAAAPEKAIAWLEQLPEGHLRAAAIDDVFEVSHKHGESSFGGSQ